MMKRRELFALIASCAATMAPAQAQPVWPSRPITLVAPLTLNSSIDLVARLLASGLKAELGQSVVVDNRPSVNGALAMGQVAHSAPDGYTAVVFGQAQVAFNPVFYADLPYSPLKDFAFVSMLATVTNVLVVPASSQYGSLADLVTAARARPGDLTYSSGGVGSSHHVSAVMFAKEAGVTVTHRPYRGAPQGIEAVRNGEVEFGFYNVSTVLETLHGGSLRALAVTSKSRSPLLTDVPTVGESGCPGFELSSWLGLATVAGTDKTVIRLMFEATRRVTGTPAWQDQLAKLGFGYVPATAPERTAELVADDISRMGGTLRKLQMPG